MDEKNTSILRRLLEKRRKESQESFSAIRLEPRFLTAARSSADLTYNSTHEEVLAADIESLRWSEYPGPECLMPYDLELLTAKGFDILSEEQLAHVRSCVPCSLLLAGLEPDDEKLLDFVRRASASTSKIAFAADSRW